MGLSILNMIQSYIMGTLIKRVYTDAITDSFITNNYLISSSDDGSVSSDNGIIVFFSHSKGVKIL